jgi:hypothetical protein
MAQSSFGRRTAAAPSPQPAKARLGGSGGAIDGLFGGRSASPDPSSASLASALIPPSRPILASLEAGAQASPEELELAAWKAARGFRMPWKQMSLIASLSFGIATFVLPDDIGDWVNWALYALSGASFIVWLKGMFGRKA